MKQNNIYTVGELFWRIWEQQHYVLPSEGDRGICFTFEVNSVLFSPVVKHERDSLVLLAARDLVSLRELDPAAFASKYSWESMREFAFEEVAVGGPYEGGKKPFWVKERMQGRKRQGKAREQAREKEKNKERDSLKEEMLGGLLYAASRLDPARQAGYVIRDSEGRRLKVDSPQLKIVRWLSVSLEESLIESQLLDVVRVNPYRGFLETLLEWKERCERVESKYERMAAFMQGVLDEAYGLDDRAYGIWCGSKKKEHPHFAKMVAFVSGCRKDKKPIIKDVFATCPIKMLWELYTLLTDDKSKPGRTSYM